LDILFIRLARLGTFLAFFVIFIGAWVRLTDAGLGCPDWPGCYGNLLVPSSTEEIASLIYSYPERPFDSGKAWREMIHRYLATLLGLVCLSLLIVAFINRRSPNQKVFLPSLLFFTVIFQGMLGMWTVTLLLKPIVVMLHLLGGLTTLSILSWLSRWKAPHKMVPAPIKKIALVSFVILIFQISLGGWTSSNYAALSCPDFPTCQSSWWPPIMDFKEGFVLWRGIGIDYEGGVLEHPARVAIHFSHRLGAIITAIFLGLLVFKLFSFPKTRVDGFFILIALIAQISLGISVILFGIPLFIAVAHNAVAALLLLTVLNVNQRINNL